MRRSSTSSSEEDRVKMHGDAHKLLDSRNESDLGAGTVHSSCVSLAGAGTAHETCRRRRTYRAPGTSRSAPARQATSAMHRAFGVPQQSVPSVARQTHWRAGGAGVGANGSRAAGCWGGRVRRTATGGRSCQRPLRALTTCAYGASRLSGRSRHREMRVTCPSPFAREEPVLPVCCRDRLWEILTTLHMQACDTTKRKPL
jgi:hypothetical protein